MHQSPSRSPTRDWKPGSPAKANVPMVAAELALIQEVRGEDFWTDVTVPMLETVRRRLRALVKLIEPGERRQVTLDIEDEILGVSDTTLTSAPAGTDIERFRAKARVFLRPHESHLAVMKLRRNEPLTPTDLAELERIFREAGASDAELDALREAGGLGLFVRSLVGLDREAAKRAFDAVQAGKTLSADQLEFLNLIVDHLTARGVMDPALLYESPFVDRSPEGIAGVFQEADVVAIVETLREIAKRAAA